MDYKGFGLTPKKKSTKISDKTLRKWVELANEGKTEYRIKLMNFYRNSYNEYSQMEGSTMIHEKDYKPMNCCLCGKHMDFIHDTHNPYPLAPHCYAKEAQENNLPHRCCGECNTNRVTPERIKGMEGKRLVTLDLCW